MLGFMYCTLHCSMSAGSSTYSPLGPPQTPHPLLPSLSSNPMGVPVYKYREQAHTHCSKPSLELSSQAT